MIKNNIKHMFTPSFSADSHLIVEINDNSYADAPIDFANFLLNFPLLFNKLFM